MKPETSTKYTVEKKIEELDPYRTDNFDYMSACSTTDCTGLIPSAPASDEEYDAYNDIYFFQPPEITANKTKSKG